jgi:hypothetical protein
MIFDIKTKQNHMEKNEILKKSKKESKTIKKNNKKKDHN